MRKNQGYCYRSQVDDWANGMRLSNYLSRKYSHSSATTWLDRMASGEIELDGVLVMSDCSLNSGSQLVWNRPPWLEEDTPQEFETLFADHHLLVVNKPSGLPTLPGGGFLLNTLLHFVRQEFPNANPMHRLGRGTSGIVLFALTSEAAGVVSSQWPNFRKTYRALASGLANEHKYDIAVPIGLCEHPRVGKVHAAAVSDVNAKTARSLAHVMERRSSQLHPTTLFEVDLITGRPHQIRIHLASIGHPLFGDPMYAAGGVLREMPGLPSDLGYHLHASHLQFEHPIEKRLVEIDCTPPEILGRDF